MSTNPVIAGNQNPLAPDTLGLPVVNIPGMQLPTTADVLNNIPGSGVAKPGHFAQLIVDGPSVFNGAVYFGASQHAAWFDCSPATVDPTVVLDFAGGPQQYLFLTRDTIIWLPTTDQQEGMFFVLVEQALSGPWLLTWKINNPTTDGSAVVIWLAGEEPVMSSAAGSVRLYTFTWCQNLNGGLGAYVGSSTLGGVVVGPASATPNAIVRFDAATGKLVQNSSVTIDDSGNLFTHRTLQSSGADNMLRLTYPLVADFDFVVNSAGQLVIDGGDVGIGMVPFLPASPLDVRIKYAKTDTFRQSAVGIWSSDVNNPFGLCITLSGAAALANRFISLQTQDMGLFNAGNLVLQDSGGNVGIGTTTPLYPLVVKVATDKILQIRNVYSGTTLQAGNDADTASTVLNLMGSTVRLIDDSNVGMSIAGGNLVVAGNMSALSITDRTPVYEGDAVAELIKVKGIDGKIDHSTLPDFARHVTKLQVASETEKDKDGKAVMVETQEEGRDLGAMISMLTVAIKQLNDRLLAVEKR